MASNTLPPTHAPVTRSVWSAKDENTLQELLDRKQRIMNGHKENLARVLALIEEDADEGFLLDVISIAEQLRDALAPFDGR